MSNKRQKQENQKISEAQESKASKQDKKAKPASKIIYLMYAALVACIVAYVLTSISVIGILAFVLIAVILVTEFRMSLKSEGGRKTVIDIMIAVVAAVLIFWVLPATVLHTSSPIDVVASCSMLPVLHRGDIVVLHGISDMSSFLEEHNIPVVSVSQASFSNMVNNMQSEFIEPFAYTSSGNTATISSVIQKNSQYTLGLYNLECIAEEEQSEPSSLNSCLVSQSTEASDLIKYNYAIADLQTSSGNASIVYVPSIVIGNTTVLENYSNPIIVYKTTSKDYFTGDIIHRLFAAIKVNNTYYLLTKGDNNPILDIESLNYPVNSSNVIGYVVGSVPYAGYPSLIIKGEVGSVPGCNQTIVRN